MAQETATAEAEILAPPEDVYKAFVSQSETKVWDPYRTTSEVRPGGSLVWDFTRTDGGICHAKIGKAEPGKLVEMEITWTKEPEWKSAARLEFTSRKEGTLVRVVQWGWLEGPKGQQLRFDFQAGWRSSLEELKAHVEIARGLVVTKVLEEMRIATRSVEIEDIHLHNRTIRNTGIQVQEAIRAQGADPIAAVLVYQSRNPWKVDVGHVFEGRLREGDDLQIWRLEGGLVVSRTYTRHPYDFHVFLHSSMLKWCLENGYRPVGPVREIYLGNIWTEQVQVPGEIQIPVVRGK